MIVTTVSGHEQLQERHWTQSYDQFLQRRQFYIIVVSTTFCRIAYFLFDKVGSRIREKMRRILCFISNIVVV